MEEFWWKCLWMCFAGRIALAVDTKSCSDIYKANILQSSGVFTIYNREQQPFQVYCDFKEGYGYTFISPNASVDINIDDLYTDARHVIIRLLKKDGTQYESRIEQIAAFKSTPLSIQFNSYTGYKGPLNEHMSPYVYIGFIPVAEIRTGQIEGYRVNGQDNTFINCDDTAPNSYFAVLFNRNNTNAVIYTDYLAMTNQWFDAATIMSSSQYMPNSIYSFFEIHFGGCGVFGTLQSFPSFQGAAVGIRYDITCPQPPAVANSQNNVGSLTAGSTVTYTCDLGFNLQSGSSTRTCAQTGTWTGVTPFCGIPIKLIEDSVNDVHFPDRLTTLGALTIHNCAIECYARPECIYVGYSETYKQCQLYDRNIGYFSTGLIAQDSTKLYRTACENTEYTFIRSLNVCMKQHTTAMNFAAAIVECALEESKLLQVDDDMRSHMDKLYPNLGGSHYYVNGRLINDTHVNLNNMFLGLLGGSALTSPIDSLAWITMEPDLTWDCVALTWDYISGTTGFKTHACNETLEFFCGHSV